MVVYLAHPLGYGDDRDANVPEAELWLEWAARQGVAPVASWITLARFWGPELREACIELNNAILRRCDQYWMCGARVSDGMKRQREVAERWGVLVREFKSRDEKASVP